MRAEALAPASNQKAFNRGAEGRSRAWGRSSPASRWAQARSDRRHGRQDSGHRSSANAVWANETCPAMAVRWVAALSSIPKRIAGESPASAFRASSSTHAPSPKRGTGATPATNPPRMPLVTSSRRGFRGATNGAGRGVTAGGGDGDGTSGGCEAEGMGGATGAAAGGTTAAEAGGGAAWGHPARARIDGNRDGQNHGLHDVGTRLGSYRARRVPAVQLVHPQKPATRSSGRQCHLEDARGLPRTSRAPQLRPFSKRSEKRVFGRTASSTPSTRSGRPHSPPSRLRRRRREGRPQWRQA